MNEVSSPEHKRAKLEEMNEEEDPDFFIEEVNSQDLAAQKASSLSH